MLKAKDIREAIKILNKDEQKYDKDWYYFYKSKRVTKKERIKLERKGIKFNDTTSIRDTHTTT